MNKQIIKLITRNLASKSNLPPSMNIFDRNLKKWQRNQCVLDPQAADYDYIKSEVGYRIVDRIYDIKRTFNTMLDLGCQKGYVSKHLTKV